MSRSKCGAATFRSGGCGQTTVFEWQTRVVVRKMNRQVPAGGQFQGQQGEIVGFLGVGRFEHRHGRGDGKAAVVLLVLARRHARIIGRDDHQRPAGARIGRGKEGIGRHVQPDVFHRDQRRRAGHSHAEGDFQGHLFVGGPLGTAAISREMFEDFRRGRAGISGAQRNAVIESRQGDRLIPAQQQPFCSRRQYSIPPKTCEAIQINILCREIPAGGEVRRRSTEVARG